MKLECPHCGDAFTYDPVAGGCVFTCGYCGLSVQMPTVGQLPPEDLRELQSEQNASVRKEQRQAEREQKKAEAQQRQEERWQATEAAEQERTAQETARETETPAVAPSPQMAIVARTSFVPVRWVVAGVLTMLGFLALTAFVTFSIVSNSAKPEIAISDVFREQLLRLLEVSGELEAATGLGINILTLKEQLAKVESSWEIVYATWPEGFEPDAQQSFQEAIKGWELALWLWGARIEKLDGPTEPNINGYAEYMAYAGETLERGTVYLNDAGETLEIGRLPTKEWLEELRSGRYKDWATIGLTERNVGVLLSKASTHSKIAKARLLVALSKNR